MKNIIIMTIALLGLIARPAAAHLPPAPDEGAPERTVGAGSR